MYTFGLICATFKGSSAAGGACESRHNYPDVCSTQTRDFGSIGGIERDGRGREGGAGRGSKGAERTDRLPGTLISPEVKGNSYTTHLKQMR